VKRQFVRWRLAQTPYNLNQRRRRVREDVRVKEEWLNPGRGERCGCSEANIKLRGTDERRLTGVLISTRRNERYRADVVSLICIRVYAGMQSRRDADEKCPGKRCKQNARNKNTRASL
jgi:ribosomal protein S13